MVACAAVDERTRRSPAQAAHVAGRTRAFARRFAAGFGVACLALVAGCRQDEQTRERFVGFEPCAARGLPAEALCGAVTVPERRDDATGRELSLRVVVVPARAARQPDAVFLLAGGPGQAASEAFAPLLPVLRDLGKDRDLVLVDQRGTGASSALACPPEPTDVASLLGEEPLDEGARACAASLAGVDLGAYTTDAAAADLDLVRAALGYERVDLLGVSYGTRLALAFAARFPERVRALVLDSVVAPDLVLPVEAAVDAQRALDALFANCAADADCARAYPDLAQRFAALLARLGASPARVSLADPRTGRPVRTTVGRGAFARALRSLLYSAELAALVPLVVDRAERDDFAPLAAALSLVAGAASESVSAGLYLAVTCQEDMPRVSPSALARSDATFVGRTLHDELARACGLFPAWTSAPPPASLVVEVPALALSGALDPVTPPHWAEEALRSLPRGRSIVVPGASHHVLPVGCVPRLVRDFVAAADASGLDASCLDGRRRPPFFLDAAGPRP